jgi:hypothetical protein
LDRRSSWASGKIFAGCRSDRLVSLGTFGPPLSLPIFEGAPNEPDLTGHFGQQQGILAHQEAALLLRRDYCELVQDGCGRYFLSNNHMLAKDNRRLNVGIGSRALSDLAA